MALLCMEGFDHFIASQVTRKEMTQASLSGFATGRFGSGNALYLMASLNDWLQKNIGVNKSTIYLGFAVRKTNAGAPQAASNYPFIRFRDESEVDQVKICINANFGIDAYRGSTLLGSSSDFVFRELQWQYMEVKVTISDTVGEVTVRINETQVLNLTSQDTKDGSDYIRYVRFHPIYNNKYLYIDDLYVDDAQFHGDCQIKTFAPDADGNSSQFTRSAGSNDYECVDEEEINDDTDYISSNTVNHKSIFGITTGALPTVKAIQLSNAVRVDEAGIRKITPIIRSNSTDYSGTESPEVPANWIFEHQIWETDPDDSNPWTQTKLEAAEFGLEITT